MGTIIYFAIGIALLAYSSVRQYQRDNESFMKEKIHCWIWWVATLGCVLLWPILIASCIVDIISEIRKMNDQS